MSNPDNGDVGGKGNVELSFQLPETDTLLSFRVGIITRYFKEWLDDDPLVGTKYERKAELISDKTIADIIRDLLTVKRNEETECYLRMLQLARLKSTQMRIFRDALSSQFDSMYKPNEELTEDRRLYAVVVGMLIKWELTKFEFDYFEKTGKSITGFMPERRFVN